MKLNPYLSQQREYLLFVYDEKAKQMKAAGVDVINLTIGDPLDETYPKVREKTLEALQGMRSSAYPKSRGESNYLNAVAGWIKRNHNLDFNPATEILSCNGSKEAIFHATMLFDWSDGKEIFIPSLSYPVYEASASLHRVPYRYLPLSAETNFFPDLDKISDADWQKCGIFWINSPHNPTTAIADVAYFNKLIAFAEKHDFIICADECYNDIYYKERPPSILDAKSSDKWLLFRSLSKRSHMTGYRCGAIISRNKTLISALARMRAPMGQGTPSFIQTGAVEAWNDDQHPMEFAKYYKERQNILRAALESKGFKIFGGDASFYLWFSHPKIKTSEEILELFLEQGIVMTPGSAFGPDGEGFVRLVFCVTDEVCRKTAERIRNIKC